MTLERGFQRVDALEKGEVVLTAQAGWLQVGSATWAQDCADVYNFSVDDYHACFVGIGKLWNHNANKDCPDNKDGDGEGSEGDSSNSDEISSEGETSSENGPTETGSGGRRTTDNSKNERHGDGGRAISKAESQIAELEEQLRQGGLSRRDKKRIKQKIQNIKRDALRKRKGESHSRTKKR